MHNKCLPLSNARSSCSVRHLVTCHPLVTLVTVVSHSADMEPGAGKKRKKVRNAKKKPKSAIKANMTAEQKAEIRIKEKFTETLEIEYDTLFVKVK